jgi:hypothetical protein
MRVLSAFAGVAVVVVILWDAFEALVLPRRVTRRLRPTRFFYASTWALWTIPARRLEGGLRETYLSFYAPLSLLLLLQLWAASLVIGFAMLQWSLGNALKTPDHSATLWDAVYMSASTFFTLGLGDVVPTTGLARALTVVEAGVGFMFLAVMVGYLPVLNQAFSRREVNIVLLDARAGSPPTAAELLRRHGDHPAALVTLLRDWEHWAADVLESHLSYPVLGYFRSQHDNQSWLAALTTILDASALVSVTMQGEAARQAKLTFAMARHAVVDLAQVLRHPPVVDGRNRLPHATALKLLEEVGQKSLARAEMTIEQLSLLRIMYEPYVTPLAEHLLMPLPDWATEEAGHDNWRATAWDRPRAAGADPSSLRGDGRLH